MNKKFVKCPECKNAFRTNKSENEETQCPHTSGGCGARFPVKGNVITI